MASSAVTNAGISTTQEHPALPIRDEQEQLIETVGMSRRGARGALLGVTLGAGLWGVILVAFGVIKL